MPRSVTVKMLAETSQYIGNIKRAGLATKDFAGELDKAAKANKLDGVTRVTAGLGLGLVGLAGTAVKFSMDFEKSMSAVSAATHAPAKDLDQLRQAAIKAGQDTQFSATEAANGVTELAKAGVSTADILGGGLKGALDLAAAGQLGVAEAAELTASALTQFKLKGEAVPHVADLLAAGAGKAQGSVHDMGAALNQSGLVAAQFGLSVEDTTGALAEFASAGLMGSDAGTSFKTMLLAIANPTTKTAGLMQDLGLSFYDAQGQFIGVAGVAEQLKTKLKDLTQEERNAALAQIFGSDAIRAASILYEDGADGVKKWANAVNDSGYAQETAARLTDNLAGDLERLKGSLETVAIQAGGGATDGLRTLAQGANATVNAFSGLPHWVQESITVLSGVGGVSLLAAAGFLKARGTVTDFMAELRDMGPLGGRAADGLGKLGSVAGKLGIAGLAVGGVLIGFKAFTDWAEKRTAPAKANIDALTGSIKEFAATGQATGELAAKYGDHLQQIGKDVAAVTKGQRDLAQATADVAAGLSDASVYQNWNPVDPQVTQRVKDLDAALSALVKGGGASQARIFLQQLKASGQLTGDQFGRLIGMLPNYTTAASAAATENSGLAKGFGSTAANAKTLTGSMESAVDAGQKLTDVWKQLHGAVVGTDKALLSANDAVAAVKKSFRENGRAVDGNTTAALKNRIAMGEATEAAAKAAQAKYEETGSVTAANKVYNGYLGQLRATLRQSGLTKKQVDRLIEAYADMPDAVTTKVGITGDKAVTNKLVALKAYQEALKSGGGVVSIRKQLSNDNADFLKYDTGGRTPMGAGIHEPVGVVHGKEFVFDAKTVENVDRQAPGFLEEVHATHGLPGYAGGGRVTWPFPTTVAKTKIPSRAAVAAAVMPDFGNWPGSPSAQRGDSGVWRSIVAMIRATGPMSGSFGNAYRPGDPKWHGSGRAVDWMGFNQDRLASFLAAKRPLELIHRTNQRDYAYTRGVNKGSFNNSLMQAHRNHIHIAMANGGVIDEPVFGVGASGNTYSLGEGYRPETVTPGLPSGGNTYQITVNPTALASPRDIGREVVYVIQEFERGQGAGWRS